ncbi:MAG: FadR family transcriptional regulator [Spirochaetales bacterium]|jgi:DNA-binding FadR family transcriptional regulator|nr:FadR family transcriptional regulator [Spirochaetales bacterium]
MRAAVPLQDRPIERSSLHSAVTRKILQRIVEQKYPIGLKLPSEREMAKELDISRPTLRQALSLLRSLGVLTVKHGSGSIVNDPQTVHIPESLKSEVFGLDVEALKQLLVARKIVEMAAIKLAASTRQDKHLEELRRLQKIMIDSLYDTSRFVSANMQFHQVLADASGNPFLADAVRSLNPKLRLYMGATTYVAHRHRQSLNQHQRIIDALAAGDRTAASRAMTGHLGSVEKNTAVKR